MRFQWSVPARNDVVRLYQFLADKNEAAAANVVRSLINAPATLLLNPRGGEKIEGFEPREVRRAIIGSYEMHYELQNDVLIVLRIWHHARTVNAFTLPQTAPPARFAARCAG
ncbi:type II toxin-antitoxin system RelE/ParE family toxin [Pluralibacter gergoviae]|uniref:type II toxin-antitoxin system RelE/ParE family toxin n=1 Tax=Pluralibacter gergoviae TaxID=61647 RepID=UPI000BFE2BCC|nr:type II toxin-antitoxin system RelE/ParE family toxin [Pluralibacter gergoviae]MCK1067576.1 type II toxin-antitoxin system RelE/ParE family toxin [Pluralibacter gergoviae]MCV7756636.1 type II toxin-antitoxin system RelE/ParE family toxin [Pluralibacter gergoviae]PHH46002.1 plasmid stabilization protein [Pluralibacter gergoviae]HDS1235298.1 type II toxin-antitoxin system RelE/ParE family toxin [Pluralibacter gergoviae]HDS1240623.1 type II toxin-antitoxin system RelE/ParE family toxin [Plural